MTFASAPVRVVGGGDTAQLLVELAETPDQRTLGLMERRQMADTVGMLFVYPTDQPATSGFWMFRTRIPLEIAFVDSTGTVRAIKQMARRGAQLSPQEAQMLRLPALVAALKSEDQDEGVRAFLEKRPPRWAGR